MHNWEQQKEFRRGGVKTGFSFRYKGGKNGKRGTDYAKACVSSLFPRGKQGKELQSKKDAAHPGNKDSEVVDWGCTHEEGW